MNLRRFRRVGRHDARHLARRDHHARRHRALWPLFAQPGQAAARLRRVRNGHRAADPRRAAPHQRLPDAPGVQHATTAKPRCCATSAACSDKDLALDRSMIPLGSCTMKLNATSEMIPITWPEFAQTPPVRAARPARRLAGAERPAARLAVRRPPATPASACSPTPARRANTPACWRSGLARQSRGEAHRNVCLIPESAHGTNPASAQMVGHAGGGGQVRRQRQRRPGRPAGQVRAAPRTTWPA